MANTDLSFYANDVYIGGNFLMCWYEAGDSATKPGYLARNDDADHAELIVCPTAATNISAHTALKNEQDIDTAYTSGEGVPYFHIGQGTKVWAKHDGTSDALYYGRHLINSNGTAGAVELFGNRYSASSGSLWLSTLATSIMAAENKATGGVAIWIQAILSN